MAQIIGIKGAKSTNDTTVYDPKCGSRSLLLKVGDAASAFDSFLRRYMEICAVIPAEVYLG